MPSAISSSGVVPGSFNEAEARTPRMRDLSGFMPRPVVSASMRPRRERLGCIEFNGTEWVQVPCFNEAEARTPRMRSRSSGAMRSIRPCFNEAEARTPRMHVQPPLDTVERPLLQ